MPKKFKKKTSASTETFTFTQGDPLVLNNLTATEIAAVTNWQASAEYVMEFHEGHDTGYPIYIRPVSGLARTETNIPKANTRNVTAGTYTSVANFENGGKLTANLTITAQTELETIFREEWETLVILARRYWANEDLPAAQQQRPDMVCGKCSTRFTGDYNLGAANAYGKYTCPRCHKETVVPA